MSHTPGPWKVDKELGSYAGVWLISMDFGDGSRGSGIARTCAEAFDGDPISNAHVIAAAPEMLGILEKLSSLLVDGEEYVPLELREEMITAIRKARGEV